MAQQPRKGLTIAILATDGFKQSELLVPRQAKSRSLGGMGAGGGGV
jgi:hypothetical protein